ncbi:MAG: RodZ domain-containing protein [Acidobacteriota bacterium]
MPSLGQQLKQAREERGLTIKQIADGTHIGTPFLQAIESDNYESLPGGIFNRAFVRKFAGQVGFDQEQAVKLYDEQLMEMGGEPAKTSYLGLGDEIEAKSASGNGVLLALIAVIVLGAILYAAYLAFAPSRAQSQPAAADPLPTPQATATAIAIAPDASTSPTVSPSPEASASPTPASAPVNELRVQLSASGGDCWINFQSDLGKSEQAFLKQGESREFTASEKINFLKVGNLPALNITINGRRANADRLAPNRKGVVAENVVITKDNFQQFVD